MKLRIKAISHHLLVRVVLGSAAKECMMIQMFVHAQTSSAAANRRKAIMMPVAGSSSPSRAGQLWA
jgi:hypothetical protein